MLQNRHKFFTYIYKEVRSMKYAYDTYVSIMLILGIQFSLKLNSIFQSFIRMCHFNGIKICSSDDFISSYIVFNSKFETNDRYASLGPITC